MPADLACSAASSTASAELRDVIRSRASSAREQVSLARDLGACDAWTWSRWTMTPITAIVGLPRVWLAIRLLGTFCQDTQDLICCQRTASFHDRRAQLSPRSEFHENECIRRVG